MTVLFTAEQITELRRPHVAQGWFGRFDLPDGEARLHTGTGWIRIDGEDWRGVSDPFGAPGDTYGGRMVSIGQVDEPVFGQAASVTITLLGVDASFMRSVHSDARAIEGRRADLYWAMFNGETGAIIGGLVLVFPKGRMSAPSLQWLGIGRRLMTLTVEGIWSSRNFAPGGMWNDADQQRRYTGDKGMAFVGQKIEEKWV